MVQKITYYYRNHDVDSSMEQIERFKRLYSSTREQLKLSESKMIARLQEELHFWQGQTEEEILHSMGAINDSGLRETLFRRYKLCSYDPSLI